MHNHRVTRSSELEYTESTERQPAPHLSGSAPKSLDILQAPVQGLPGVCIARGVVCDHEQLCGGIYTRQKASLGVPAPNLKFDFVLRSLLTHCPLCARTSCIQGVIE